MFLRCALLAFGSGVPALVYQVAWTRQAGLAVASQIEALAVVVAAFFGGLAAGAHVMGPLADRVRRPLRLYGALEMAAGLAALATVGALPALGAPPWSAHTPGARLLLAGLGVGAISFLLGGTLPALLRAAAPSALGVARTAGLLVAANTAGAVAGVAAAALVIPAVGIRAALSGAALAGIAIGLVALVPRADAASRRREAAAGDGGAPGAEESPPRAPTHTARPLALAAHRLSWRMGALAFAAGAATLAFEVLATRAAALRLGSSLLAWSVVLGLFLLGLALGNAALARTAGATAHPWRLLARIELAAWAVALAAAAWLAPAPTHAAAGLSGSALLRVTALVLPAAVLAGAAFPLLVRVGVHGGALGASFGSLSALNTAGGIAGSLAAPFVLLDPLDLPGAFVAAACANALVAAVAFARARARRKPTQRGLALAVATTAALAAAVLVASRAPEPSPSRLLFADDGRQASAAVVWRAGGRHLYVDGDPEAANVGAARRTEELLALLPLALRPDATRIAEVGFGSGITLATAARAAPAAELECVEIAPSVRRAARLFAPENDGLADGHDPRVTIVHGDGRAWLATRRAPFDVVLLNTVQPWSIGATGLYSRQYFERVREALAPGGLAAQWLPIFSVGEAPLAALVRTFVSVFPEGSIWWSFDDLLLVGANDALPDPAPAARPALARGLARIGLEDGSELRRRRMASAAAAREALGPGRVLDDDHPWLEAAAARARAGGGAASEAPWPLLERIARAGAHTDPAAGALLLWVQSRRARSDGDGERADRLETLAARAGLALAAEGRHARLVALARTALREGDRVRAEARVREVLSEAPAHPDAWLVRAQIRLDAGDLPGARHALRAALAADASRVDAWLALAQVLERAGDLEGVDQALARTLDLDPFAPPALGAAGLRAVARGELERAREMLARLEALDPRGTAPERRALAHALAEAVRSRGRG